MAELDLRLLRYFVAVTECEGFTAASSVLHVTQPALSQAVHRLESLVGTPLLDRHPQSGRKGVVLTPAGEVLYGEAVELLNRATVALERVRGEGRKVRLRLGFGTNTPRQLTDLAIRAASRLTDVEMSLEHVLWGEERERLGSGQVDLAYLQVPRGFSDPGLDVVVLKDVTRVAVFSRRHRLADRRRLRMADLRDEPIIDAASDRDFWLVNPRPGYPLPPVVTPAARTVEEMLAFVSADLGMAITSHTVAEQHPHPDLSYVDVEDLHPVVLCLAWRRSDDRPAVAGLAERIVAEWQAGVDRPPETVDKSGL